MASTAFAGNFVSIVAEEMASGIHRALRYWLGRIEIEATDRRLSAAERISAIQRILAEYEGLADNSGESSLTYPSQQGEECLCA